MTIWTLFAAAFSAICLVRLALRDPKRMRATRMTGSPASPRQRRALMLAALCPGVVLAATGDAAAFLVWLGTGAVAGWLAALWLGTPREGWHGRDRPADGAKGRG